MFLLNPGETALPETDARLSLARCLLAVARCDHQDPPDYQNRYRLVFGAMYAALKAGIPAGIALDPAEPDWPVVYIELPTGQVSWHMPAHPTAWDGHSTEEKYNRCHAYASSVL
jgi:hypothetical protein